MVPYKDSQLAWMSSRKSSKTGQEKQKRVLEDSIAHDWLTDSFYYQTGQNSKIFLICTTYKSVFLKKHFWVEFHKKRLP